MAMTYPSATQLGSVLVYSSPLSYTFKSVLISNGRRGYRIRSRCVSKSSERRQISSSTSVDGSDVVVRVVAEQELWAVADVHTSAFYPKSNFLLDPFMKLDKVLTLMEGREHQALKLPTKCACLVAKRRSSTNSSTIKQKNPFIISFFKSIFPADVCDGLGLSRTDMDIYGAVNIDTIGYNLPSKTIIKNGRQTRIRENGCAYLSNLAVAPEMRKRKIGSTLVEACEFVAKKWGCWGLALHCDPRNEPAFNLYTKLGYAFPDRTNEKLKDLCKARARFDGNRLMVKLL